ncbi:MAG: GH32 C-terminal domain-containing protein [Planctomycetia bacterium]|nr:GH32 C-terminal domain-containing protein [Planctomycetia bacterium]
MSRFCVFLNRHLLLLGMFLLTFPVVAQESITDKTMIAWVSPANLEQRGGSVLTLDMANPDAFDAIVFGEIRSATWMPGSSTGQRLERNQDSWPQESVNADQFIQIAIVYHGKEISIYRNGNLYVSYLSPGEMQEFNLDASILIGPRHMANQLDCFAGRIQDVRVYPVALDSDTIAAMKPGQEAKGLAPWLWFDFTENKINDRTGQWPIIKTEGDVKVEDGALCLGPQWGMLHCRNRIKEYVSSLPRYEFPEKLSEQIKSLQSNPLVQRFAESRAKLASDPYRPIYHFTSPFGSLNDPNGLCYYQGNWHLFYQFFVEGGMNDIVWGHAYSDDLVHWKDLPPALYRGPEENCWSGSVCIDGDLAIATYFGNQLGTMVATSHDPLLLNWEKVTGDTVIPIPRRPVEYQVFDSCIWKDRDRYYILSAGTKTEGEFKTIRPAWYLFESEDLAHWNYLHQFAEDDYASRTWDDGACPYFWPIGDQSDPETARSILLNFSHTTGGKYLIGKYDRDRQKFFVHRGDFFNHGASTPCGLHAPSAFPDGKDGLAVIFNVNYGEGGYSYGCNQVMSLPMQLNLLPNDQLGIKPFESLESLRYDPVGLNDQTLPANQEIVLNDIQGRSAEFDFTIDSQKADAIELKVLRSPENDEYTRIVLYPNRGYRAHGVGPGHYSVVDLDTSHSSLKISAKRPTEQAQVYIPQGEAARIRVFVDRSIVEVFVNDCQILSARVYPEQENSDGVSIQAIGGDALLKSLEAWKMKAIFPSSIE